MTQVVVPVRYPLSKHSKATLAEAIETADREDATLTVLHINLYQDGGRITRSELKDAVETAFGPQSDVRYTVRSGFLVEESILKEVAEERADIVVIGRKQVSRWRRMINRLVDDPDIGRYLEEKLDARLVTVEAP